jgi:hypothetical protein
MKKIIFLSALFSVLAFACNEEVLVKENANNQTTETYFKNSNELSSALTGVYAILQSNGLLGREWFFLHDLRSDEVDTGGGQLETPRNQVLIGSFDAGNSVVGAVWTNLYRLIHRANAVIQFAPTATMSDETLRARYVGEAKFLRAWAYFNLYTMWGGVPVYDKFVTTLDGAKERSTADQVKAVIISDLNDAIASLPDTYSGNDLGRAPKGAAQFLLAKLYMFNAEYNNAKPLLDAVITAGETRAGGNPLMAKYFDNFTEEAEYNKESIWEVSYNSNGNYNWDGDGNDYGPNESWIRSQEYSAVGWRNLIPSNKLLAEFEDNDPRLKDVFYFTGDKYGDPASQKVLTDGDQRGNGSIFKSAPMKVSWKKYSVMYKLDPGGFYDKIGINYRMMRFADAYLLAAEAENEVGSPAKALTYLNKTRTRVGMPLYPTATYPTTTKTEIMKAIMHERAVELSGEEVRNYDILRWRKANKFVSEPLSYYSSKFELLPIPQNELDSNPKIDAKDQNPGY